MPYQLILTSDTLDIGRQKINSFMQSSTGVWSSDTPNYAVVSTQGGSNSNYALSNYAFVTGKNNEVKNTLGVFSVIAGGYNNYCNGPYSSILGGYNNRQINSAGISNTIIGGKNNTINETIANSGYRSYNTIIGGQSNTVNGQRNLVVQNSNAINIGRGNTVIGSQNTITRNSAPPGNVGPQANLVQGNYHTILGAGGAFMNMLRGFTHTITDASAAFSSHNTLFGNTNKVYGGGGFNFLVGSFINNRDSSSGNKSNCIAFGQGVNAATPLLFHPSSSQYQFVLGSQATRRFRFRFDGSPAAYMSSGSGSWQVGTADYGEYFEWQDGNHNKDNRAGFFVEIVDGKIRIAQSTNVIGVVSKNPGFVGDSVQDYWSEMYLKDEWGVPVTQKLQKFYIVENEQQKFVYFDSEGNCFSEIPHAKNRENCKMDLLKEQCTFQEEIDAPVQNPNYDPTVVYVPRKERKEWEVIGLLGKLRVRTKEQITGNSVDVDPTTGMAKNGTKYPILKRNKDFDGNYGIVTIFFK
jgi:hypothetical protein